MEMYNGILGDFGQPVGGKHLSVILGFQCMLYLDDRIWAFYLYIRSTIDVAQYSSTVNLCQSFVTI